MVYSYSSIALAPPSRLCFVSLIYRVRGGLFHLAIKVLKDGFGLSKKEAKESKDHLQPSNGKFTSILVTVHTAL